MEYLRTCWVGRDKTMARRVFRIIVCAQCIVIFAFLILFIRNILIHYKPDIMYIIQRKTPTNPIHRPAMLLHNLTFSKVLAAKASYEIFVPYALKSRAQDEALFTHAHQWVNASLERKARYSRFLPQMTVFNKARLLCTWRVFDNAARAANLSYFLADGTLLGAYRHRGMIPWDDDIDVAMYVREKDKIQQVLSCIPGYSLRHFNEAHLKFFSSNTSSIPSVCPENFAVSRIVHTNHNSIPYPFIDIFMYTSDGNYTWSPCNHAEVAQGVRNTFLHPLTTTTFEGFTAQVPRRTKELLALVYDLDICLSPSHNHQTGRGMTHSEKSRVECRELKGMYPMYNVM